MAVLIYSFALSLLIAWVIEVIVGFRVSPEDEIGGVDERQHAEIGYHFGDDHVLSRRSRCRGPLGRELERSTS